MIFAFAGQKGGVGKSTLSMSVAGEFLEQGKNVLLVDGDHEQGTVRVFAEIAAEEGLPSPTVVAMGASMYRPEQLPSLAKNYDVVIVDCPPRSAEVLRAAIMVADVVVLPVGPNPAEIWALANTADLVEQAKVVRPDLSSCVVINRKDSRTVLGRNVREALDGVGIPVLQTEISHRIVFAEAPAAGLGVTKYAPRDPASSEIRSLVKELSTFGEGR